jgi:hypothetical protein
MRQPTWCACALTVESGIHDEVFERLGGGKGRASAVVAIIFRTCAEFLHESAQAREQWIPTFLLVFNLLGFRIKHGQPFRFISFRLHPANPYQSLYHSIANITARQNPTGVFTSF